jgi:hypothetical protein
LILAIDSAAICPKTSLSIWVAMFIFIDRPFVLLADKKNVIRMVIVSQGKTYQSDNNYY